MNGDCKDNKLLEKGKLLIDMASQELRGVYTGIYPHMLGELGLKDTIDWFIRNFLEASGMEVINKNTLVSDVPYNLSINIYRIMQELFNNIVRHAEADTVTVLLCHEGNSVVIEISDNGKGFDIEKAGKTCTGAGLINVRKRVEYLKGHLEMESIPEEHGLK